MKFKVGDEINIRLKVENVRDSSYDLMPLNGELIWLNNSIDNYATLIDPN